MTKSKFILRQFKESITIFIGGITILMDNTYNYSFWFFNIRKILFLLLILIIPFVSHSQICEPSSKPTPHFGAHIGPEFTNIWNMINSGYGANYGSANMGNQPGGHAMVFLGPDGWPRADKDHTFGINFSLEQNPNLKVSPGDIFHCQYKGTLSQLGNGSPNQTFGDVSLANVVEADGYVTFDLKVTSNKTRQQLGGTKFPIKGHIEEVQIMRPGYVLNDIRMVTDECKAYLKGLKVVRLMGPSGCNSNMEREWKHRTPANAPFDNSVNNGDDYNIDGNKGHTCFEDRASNPFLPNSFNQQRSYPWEKAIDLCNYLDVDFYINLPVLIDQNYAYEIAKLLKARMKPTLNVYVEIGNELWNFGGGGAFKGFAMSFAAVHNMVVVRGDKTIEGGFNNIPLEAGNYGTGTWWTGGMGNYTAARRWPAYRLKQFMEEFAKVWGFAEEGGVGGRIRAVLAGQLSYGWGQDYWFIGNEGIGFLERAFGKGTAKKYLYGLGITHYSNVPKMDVNASVDDLLKALYHEADDYQFGRFGGEGDGRNPDGTLRSSGDCEGNELEDVLATAKRYGLKVIAYEGGPEVNGDNWSKYNNRKALYDSPQFYDFILHTTTKWYSWLGYDALLIKNGFFTQNDYGSGYAIAEKEGDLSPQYKAYHTIMNNPAPPLTRDRGGVIGADNARSILPAWQVASYKCYQYRASTGPDGGTRSFRGTKDRTEDIYIIRNETNGLYSLRLNTRYNGKNAYYDIYMDGKIIVEKHNFNKGAGTLPGESYRWQDSLKFNIPYGTHSIVFEKSFGDVAESNMDVREFEYTLLGEQPPAMPDVIYGDLVVCNGNTKAKYEVSPVDFSACEYTWSGLPSTAKILPKDNKPPVSGQGSYLMYVDWGSTPNGTYDLKVIAHNQSKIAPHPKLYSPERIFKVTVKTCGFTVNPTPVCLNQKVTFDPEPLPDIKQYIWDSGDEAAGANRFVSRTTDENYEYTYTKPGEYDVALRLVKNDNSDLHFFNKVNVTSCNSPIVETPVKYCIGDAPKVLTADGTSLTWYTVATGGTGSSQAPTPSTTTAGTTSYWVSQMNLDKESDRSKIDVVVSEAPAAPTVAVLNPYCVGATASAADLTSKVTFASGTTARWYADNNTTTTSTATPTAPNTTAATTATWYVSQAIGTCESPKSELKVSVIEGPKFNVTPKGPETCGKNGQLILTGLAANAAYKVSYNTTAAISLNAKAIGEIVIDVPSGTYRNIKVDNLSCSSTDASVHSVVDPTPPSFTVTPRDPSVCGSLGALVLKGLKNNTAYKVSYNGRAEEAFSSQGDSIVVSVAKGTYSKIKVILGECAKEDAAAYTLKEPIVVPPVALTNNFEYCQNQVVNVTDITSRVQGDPAYKLRWYTDPEGTPANQPTVSTTESGRKNLWVSQANEAGCSSDKVVLDVIINPSTVLAATGNDPTECGKADGKIEIKGLQNLVSYRVEYKIGEMSQQMKEVYSNETGTLMIEGLTGGVYKSITVTPKSGSICLTKGAEEVILKEPGSPEAPEITGGIKNYCDDEAKQPLTATGTDVKWYSDKEGITQVSPTSSYTPQLTTGTVTYYAIAFAGTCKSVPASASISIVPKPTVKTVTGTRGPATCNGTGNDVKVVTEVGVKYQLYNGTSPYGEPVSGLGREQVLGKVSEEGTYTVKAQIEGSTCEATAMNGEVIVDPIKATKSDYTLAGASVCEGSVTTVDVKLSGSEVGVEYGLLHNELPVAILPGTGSELSFTREAKASSNGAYKVTATNTATGCSIDMPTQATILVQSGLAQPIIAETGPFCNKGTTQLNASPIDASSTLSWTMSPLEAGSINGTGQITWNNSYTGDVMVNLKVTSGACVGVEKTATLSTKTTNLPVVTVINGDEIVCRGAMKQYQVSPVTPGMTYNWEITSNVNIHQKDDATGTVTFEYNVEIPAEGIQIRVSPKSEECGIGLQISKTVKKGEGCDLFVPNVLTPGSTDNNSIWAIEGINNFPKLNIQIFNRWGAKVYSNIGPYTKPWDGTYNGQPLPTATYYYVIDKADGSEKMTGSVTVVRD